MTTGRITLDLWLQDYDPRCRPSIHTAREWAKAGKLEPPAEKAGRSWYVEPGTRYTPQRAARPRKRLLQRILDGEKSGTDAPRSAP